MDDSDRADDDPSGFSFEELFGSDPNEMLAGFMSLFGGAALPGAGGGTEQAVQIAISVASGGAPESNVEPTDRMALEQLGRVAELQIAETTGLRPPSGSPLSIAPVNRTEWVRRSMRAYKPLLEELAAAMAKPAPDDGLHDPELAMLDQLFGAIRPLMVNLTTGSMVGHLGSRALGTYDLPIPRPDSNELLVVVPNLDAFGREWSLERDDLRLWIVLSEVAHHVVLSLPHVSQRITSLLTAYARAFRNDPTALGDSLGELEPGADFAEMQTRLQELFGDPTALLGAIRSAEQEAILPELAAITGAVVGYVDHVMDQIGTSLIPGYRQLTEALRRRRVTASASDRFVERLLGLELDQALYDRGRAFVDGVVDRAGGEGLARLWESDVTLPTPNELDAPGLWLARIELELE